VKKDIKRDAVKIAEGLKVVEKLLRKPDITYDDLFDAQEVLDATKKYLDASIKLHEYRESRKLTKRLEEEL
jgi:pyrroloquinoline quinone (PQQ) biosynthesis protein C